MRRLLIWAPLAVFAIFLAVVIVGLSDPAERTIRSRLVGQPVPEFQLPPALPGREGVSSADYAGGEPRLLNVFASWCVPCIAEAPYLMKLAERGLPIDAVAIRDRPEDIARFLADHGDPYRNIGADVDSSVQMALGSSGVPETFIVDGAGVIRYQHIGIITDREIPDILAAWEEARR